MGVACQGHGSREDKKKGTDANITEEKAMEQWVIGAQEEEESRVVLRLQGPGTTVIRVGDGKVRGGTGLWGKLSNLVLDVCSFEHMLCQALGQAVGVVGRYRKMPDWCFRPAVSKSFGA